MSIGISPKVCGAGFSLRGTLVPLALLQLLAACLPLPAATWYLTVTGLGGEPEYVLRFKMLGDEIDKALKGSGADAKVTTLQNATREQVRNAFAQISHAAKPDDALVVMLVGHGSFDGAEYKINLQGPDISAAELANLLDRVPATRQLVVNMTSSSGGSMDVLRKSSRIVITATKSGSEKNATVFAKYWAAALTDAAADTDKNETISALEAFKYAEAKTANYYETNKRLATEHAVLEDTGKGEGVKSPSAENGEGLLAGRFPLVRRGALASAASDTRKRELVAKREQISISLWDAENKLLFTGDMYYPGAIFLFRPETDLDAYEASIRKMAALGAGLLLPAHNVPVADPADLPRVLASMQQARSGKIKPVKAEHWSEYKFEGFSFLLSK